MSFLLKIIESIFGNRKIVIDEGSNLPKSPSTVFYNHHYFSNDDGDNSVPNSYNSSRNVFYESVSVQSQGHLKPDTESFSANPIEFKKLPTHSNN